MTIAGAGASRTARGAAEPSRDRRYRRYRPYRRILTLLTVAAVSTLIASCALPAEPTGNTAPPSTATDPTVPTAADGGPTVIVTLPPIGGDATSEASSDATATSERPTTVAVDLGACTGCRVLAAVADVHRGVSAALAATPTGAALLSVDGAGRVIDVINVPYGTVFETDAGPVLPCDTAGRCFVRAATPDGTAIVSAFELDATGAWGDVTAAGGFRSATPIAAVLDVNGDGVLEIAVQASRPQGPLWVVHAWSGERFTVLGCQLGGGQPTAAGLSRAACDG